MVLVEHRHLDGTTAFEELRRILRDKLRIAAPRVREIVSFIREHADVAAPAAPAPWPRVLRAYLMAPKVRPRTR